ncbi:MAG: hypothetical protein JW854_14115 [Actinobacteria bacterium]|nr:hypothetical protein [Actinomycetota bacterium]
MRTLLAILLALSLVLVSGCGAQEPASDEGTGGNEAGELAEVPADYQDTYAELEEKLEELDAYLDDHWDGETSDTVFSVELVNANSNRGEALLKPYNFLACQRTLESLKDLGVTGITLSVQYPVLNPDFPRSSDYLMFYRWLALETRSLGLNLIVETTTIFPDPEISPLGVDYAGLTLDEYMREKRAMIETVVTDIAPDYLTVENEPGTQRANTGLDFTVADQTAIVNHILSGLDRGETKIGAGAGSWDDPAYFESLAANTDVDYLDIHFYPIQGDLVIDRAERVSEMARSHAKGLAVSEAWLYKASGSELSPGQDIAMAADTFARDAFDFWTPLDQSFLEVLVKLSHYLDMEFISPFWMQYLFAYLPYSPTTEGRGYAWVLELVNSQTWVNIQAGNLTPTGETYRELIMGQ